MGTKPVSTNPLGQMRDEFVESVADAATDTAKAIISEPKKILEAILGGSSSSNPAEGSVEDLTQQAQAQTDDPQKQQQYVQKAMEEQQKTNELISFHRQKLKEEEEYYKAKNQQEEVEKDQAEKQEEEQKKQNEIIQIERRSADIQKAAQLAGQLGSKEQGKQISG
jgi:hypothetical protein